MADSGDGVNSTSSGKETRNMLADGPVTDPASSMKVNRAGLQPNLKSRTVSYAPCYVRANRRAVCHDCRICRRSHDKSIGERSQNARLTSPSTILPATSVSRPAEMKSFDVRPFFSLLFTLVSSHFSFVLSLCLLSPTSVCLCQSLYQLLTCVSFVSPNPLKSCDHMWLLRNWTHGTNCHVVH